MGSIIAALLGVVGGAHGQTLPNTAWKSVFESGESGYEFTRGVDVWQDGTLFWVESHAPTDNLYDSTEVKLHFYDDLRGYPTSPSPLTLGFAGPTPSTIWAHDLRCENPNRLLQVLGNEECQPGEFIPMGVVLCGGFNTVLDLPIVTEEDEETVDETPPGGQTYNARNAWIRLHRFDGQNTFNTYETSAVPHIFTDDFVAKNASSWVDAISIDSIAGVQCDNKSEGGDHEIAGNRIFVGGVFEGSVQFSGPLTFQGGDTIESLPGTSGEAAYVAMLDDPLFPFLQPFMRVVTVLELDSAGDDGVLGVSFSPLNGEIVVCGYFGGTMDFDPNGATAVMRTPVGTQDAFIASYGREGLSNEALVLRWVETYGRAGEKSAAEGVWAEGVWRTETPFLHEHVRVFWTGWFGDSSTAFGGDCADLVVGAIDPVSIDTPNPPTLRKWTHVFENDGDERGLDICVDGLGRPVVTGSFGSNQSGYSFDIDPSASTHILTTQGLHDVFVASFTHAGGLLREAYSVGDDADDWGSDIANCQHSTSRMVHAGDFGGQVTFDPNANPQTASIVSAANRDGFTNAFVLTQDVPSTHHVTLAVPNQFIFNQLSYATTFQPLFDAISTQVPTDSTVSLQVLRLGMSAFFDRTTSNIWDTVVQSIPITTITSQTDRDDFVRRFRSLSARHISSFNPQSVHLRVVDGPAVLTANYNGYNGASSGDWPGDLVLDPGCYRHLLTIDDSATPYFGASIATSLAFSSYVGDDIVGNNNGPKFIDQLNFLMVDTGGLPAGYDRESVSDHLTESNRRFTAVSGGFENDVAMAALTTTVLPGQTWLDTDFPSIVERMVMRMTVWPGDYNRVSGVQATPTIQTGVDWNDFVSAYGTQALYADWNFSSFNPFDPNGWQTNKDDGKKFFECFNVTSGCP